MADKPLLTGEFVKVIDNDGKIRIPRTTAQAVQLRDGSDLQDYIDFIDEVVLGTEGDTGESIVETIEDIHEILGHEDEVLNTEEQTIVGAINEIHGLALLTDDDEIYEDNLNLLTRIEILEEMARNFTVENETDEFNELLNTDTSNLSEEERVTRLERLFELYVDLNEEQTNND